MSGKQNVCLKKASHLKRQLERTKRRNPQYYNQDIITEFDI